MEETDRHISTPPLSGAVKQFLHRLMAIVENRFHLFFVEVEEERNRLLDMVFMAIATATLGLLGIIALSAALVVAFWQTNPVLVLVGLGLVYLVAAGALAWRVVTLRRLRPSLSGTLDQLKKDRECLTRN